MSSVKEENRRWWVCCLLAVSISIGGFGITWGSIASSVTAVEVRLTKQEVYNLSNYKHLQRQDRYLSALKKTITLVDNKQQRTVEILTQTNDFQEDLLRSLSSLTIQLAKFQIEVSRLSQRLDKN
jgi:hypothetical protein